MSDQDIQDFVVTDVQMADDSDVNRVAIILADARGGSIRLHLNADMAELLRERVSKAIDRKAGP